jgi:probable F420-dependent oxidoreductase
MNRDYWEFVQSMPAYELSELTRRFEDLGLYGVWAPQMFAPPFPALAAAAMVTSKLRLGTGIAMAFVRSPVETALSALDIDRLSGGRFVLGLGTSVRDWNERVNGVIYGKPVAHLREVVTIVRAIIEKGHTGDLGEFNGEYHKLDLRGFNTGRKPVRGSIPIYVPALFEKTVDLAAEATDGLLGHPMWSLQWIREQSMRLNKLLQAHGRKRSDFHLNLWHYVAIAKDRKQAIDDLRGTVAFYSSMAQYRKYYAAHGFEPQAKAAYEAAACKDTTAMLKAIPDEMVTAFALAGTPDEVREGVSELWQHANSMSLSPPHVFLPAQRTNEYREALLKTLYEEARRTS